MPEISRFYGIDIRTLALISGGLPGRALGLVAEWSSLHRDELLELWELARESKQLHKIAPLP